jgi:putative intracellular protease/amidase
LGIALAGAVVARAQTAPAGTGVPCTVQTNWICPNTPLATPCYIIDSGKTGPVVMVVSGIHGDEEGYAAAGQIRAWTVRRGKLIVLPQANRPAVLQHSHTQPGDTNAATRDLNRNFPTKAGDAPRGELATAIWAQVRALKPDWLVDLHEGFLPSAVKTNSLGNSLIMMYAAARQPAASNLLAAVNATLTNRTQRFLLRRVPLTGSLARAAADQLHCNALLVEICHDNANIPQRIRLHRLVVHRLLCELEMEDGGPDVLARKNPAVTLVALYDDTGGHATTRIEAKLEQSGDIQTHRVDSAAIEAGVLDQFDVLFSPGGSGSVQGRALGPQGREAIRNFVKAGGGYVGICAGAYLASRSETRPYLGILNASISDFNRGRGLVKIELTGQGQKLLGRTERELAVSYHNGPVWGPGSASAPACDVLARFRTEVFPTKRTTQVTMAGTPAMLAGRYGLGRVLCSSPHPEAMPDLDESFRRMIRWAAGK